MKNYVAAVDAGTGGVRCVLYDAQGNSFGQHYREMTTIYTGDGRAEQDPNAFIDCAYAAVRGAIANSGIDPAAIVGVSFSGTQTTFVALDENDRFITNLILWQDMRSTAIFPQVRKILAANGMTEDNLYRRTFRPLDNMAVGGKLLWIREKQPEVYQKIRRVVNPLSVLQRAFGAEDHTIDPTDCGWFFAHDPITLKPDPALAKMFDIDPGFFPDPVKNGALVGRVTAAVSEKTGLRVGTPLFQGSVDQCCAALGAGNGGCESMGTLCMGTVGLLMTYSDNPIPDPRCRYYIIHYPTGGYASELAVPVAASAFRWVRDMLYPAEAFDLDDIYPRMDAEAATSPIGAGGLAFLPHMAGSIYPKMNSDVRGGWVGCSLSTRRADLVRASLEGISYGIRQILEAGGHHFEALRLLGGAARSPFWNQMQADIYNCQIVTLETEEASALGAAIIAATGAGLYESIPEAVRAMSRIKHCYTPNPENVEKYNLSYEAWKQCAEGLENGGFAALEKVRQS